MAAAVKDAANWLARVTFGKAVVAPNVPTHRRVRWTAETGSRERAETAAMDDPVPTQYFAHLLPQNNTQKEAVAERSTNVQSENMATGTREDGKKRAVATAWSFRDVECSRVAAARAIATTAHWNAGDWRISVKFRSFNAGFRPVGLLRSPFLYRNGKTLTVFYRQMAGNQGENSFSAEQAAVLGRIPDGSRLLVMDADGTIYRDSIFLKMFEKIESAGLVDKADSEKIRKMNAKWKDRETNYEEYLASVLGPYFAAL